MMKTINDFVKLVSNTNISERVSKEKGSEGLPEWYIEIYNRVTVGMYIDDDYRIIFGTTDPTEICYLPKELREKVTEMLDH